ncbi:hypothetical protein AArcSl_0757 [Halalkaliarchaeum desulfuricum]|uniref:Uncharacterized protein n=1 Tax=Halalkaliarchaeum desulfuricum TaxID=2055893 RepID=A0A343TH31_9EURY|nr:hypothetical protein [Halalkaliarchaeum desulfuricum]AUX08403.1 hypothetical protein AArcSl_0757 [Halalkaliarchaeum desulfuricum]
MNGVFGTRPKVVSSWALAEDVAASRVGSVVGLQQIEAEYGDDAYGKYDDWAAQVRQLDENA